jgi:hypothetical protein
MSKMIQVRNVPERLHRDLARRARRQGLTLTMYIQRILEREVARRPAAEIFDRVEASPAIQLGQSAAELIREERGGRDTR